jgi:hypothetical protein
MLLDGFTDTLKKAGRIEIRGLGGFTVRHYGAYAGRNPRTGKAGQCRGKEVAVLQSGKGIEGTGEGVVKYGRIDAETPRNAACVDSDYDSSLTG